MSETNQTQVAALGLAAYTLSVAAVRYGSDAAAAPSVRERMTLLRQARERLGAWENLEELCERAGLVVDLEVVSAPFVGGVEDVAGRMQPADWSERLTQTYLMLGLLADFARAGAAGLASPWREQVAGILVDDAEARTAGELASLMEGDAQLVARLGLWGRRVVGEEMGALMRLVAQVPDLLADGVDRSDLHEVLSDGAIRRMRGLGLRV